MLIEQAAERAYRDPACSAGWVSIRRRRRLLDQHGARSVRLMLIEQRAIRRRRLLDRSAHSKSERVRVEL
jgi:hypothetical protein